MDFLLQATPIKTCRMVTINDTERDLEGNTLFYRLLPAGEPVAVPDRLVRTSFVQDLLSEGVIINLGAVDGTEEEEDGETLESLKEQATELGIPFDGRWSRKKLKLEIDKLA